MKTKILNPEQIMTTHDFPVHNEHILKIYFSIAKNTPENIPPTPVIHKSLGLPLLEGKDTASIEHNKAVKKFFEDNPEVEYIMCDGSHKTTALTLTNNKIHASVIESDEDIKEIKELVNKGEMFSFSCEDSIKEMLIDQAKHYSKSNLFHTVKSKTLRMIKEKIIPQFMIDHYNKI
jgi:hypothetical protein